MRNLNLWDLIFGAVSLIGFWFGIGSGRDPLLILASLLILLIIWVSYKLRPIDEQQEELRKLNEKVDIYRKLADYDARIKNLEGKHIFNRK